MVNDSTRRRLINSLKKLVGISDWSLFKKKLTKKIGKIFYKKKYDVNDLLREMQKMGLEKGQLVCVHAAMREFYNFNGSAEDIINGILKVIGPEGTLMMPAFPKHSSVDDNYIMNIDEDSTGAGYLAEVFRRYPGVKRSVNVQHSVCAIGPMADYLTKDHQDCIDCWDQNSPWGRLCQKNGIVFTLGMQKWYIPTFQHCVESRLKNENEYWKSFFKWKRTYRYYNSEGKVCSYTCETSTGLLERVPNNKRTIKWFSVRDRQEKKLSNLRIVRFYSGNCLIKMISLGRLGISPYKYPSTKGYSF